MTRSHKNTLPSIKRGSLVKVSSNKTSIKPVKWDKRYLDIIEKLAAKGHTQREIADILGVHLCTIEYWIRTKQDVRQAFHRGEKELVSNVKRSYVSLALGYSHPDTVILTDRVTEYDEEGKPLRSYTRPLKVPITKYYPPNAYACHKILTIKDRENWADIHRTEETVNLNLSLKREIKTDDFTMEEMLAIRKLGLQRLALKSATPIPEDIHDN